MPFGRAVYPNRILGFSDDLPGELNLENFNIF